MGFKDPSFLDTEQEHDRWHHGLYRGIAIQNPIKLGKAAKANDISFKKWYKDDYHYHDVSMFGAYALKAGAVGGGLYIVKKLGIPL